MSDVSINLKMDENCLNKRKNKQVRNRKLDGSDVKGFVVFFWEELWANQPAISAELKFQLGIIFQALSAWLVFCKKYRNTSLILNILSFGAVFTKLGVTDRQTDSQTDIKGILIRFGSIQNLRNRVRSSKWFYKRNVNMQITFVL